MLGLAHESETDPTSPFSEDGNKKPCQSLDSRHLGTLDIEI